MSRSKERSPSDSARREQAFALYRDMGPSRTYRGLQETTSIDAQEMEPTIVKGRETPVLAYRIQVVEYVPGIEAGAGIEGERV